MKVLMAHNPAIRDCYKVHRKRNPGLRGKIIVRLAVDPNGAVSRVEIVESNLNSPELESCILSKIRRWNDFGFGDPTADDEVYRQVYTFGT